MHMVLNSDDGKGNTEESKHPPPIPEPPEQDQGLPADRAQPQVFVSAVCTRAWFLLFGGWQKAADPVLIIPSDRGTSASPYGSKGDCRVLGTLLLFVSAAPQDVWDRSYIGNY